MGLIKIGYQSKSTGVYMPTAYAKLKNLVLESNDNVRAVFVVQSNRENANLYKPMDEVTIYFKWDRKADLAKMAYEKAKTQTVKAYNDETNTVEEEQGLLYGWDNDIVEE